MIRYEDEIYASEKEENVEHIAQSVCQSTSHFFCVRSHFVAFRYVAHDLTKLWQKSIKILPFECVVYHQIFITSFKIVAKSHLKHEDIPRFSRFLFHCN